MDARMGVSFHRKHESVPLDSTVFYRFFLPSWRGKMRVMAKDTVAEIKERLSIQDPGTTTAQTRLATGQASLHYGN